MLSPATLLWNAGYNVALLTRSAGTGYTHLNSIESVLQPLENTVAPNKTQSVLGFGTGSKLQKTKVRLRLCRAFTVYVLDFVCVCTCLQIAVFLSVC